MTCGAWCDDLRLCGKRTVDLKCQGHPLGASTRISVEAVMSRTETKTKALCSAAALQSGQSASLQKLRFRLAAFTASISTFGEESGEEEEERRAKGFS
ncbi:unnamed protein product [Sphagnum compactum]